MIPDERNETLDLYDAGQNRKNQNRLSKVLPNFLLLIAGVALSLLVGELLARSLTDWHIDYYTAPKKAVGGSTHIHPYGNIPVNSDGMFDAEFDASDSRPIIAYFGDSVAYGVGAGYPYRFTEYLEELAPAFQHYNLSSGLGVDLDSYRDGNAYRILRKYNIRRIVYALNLNDIFPLSTKDVAQTKAVEEKKPFLKYVKALMLPLDNVFRAKSYLYNLIRLSVKNVLTRSGFEASGFYAIELFPEENRDRIVEAADYINSWAARMKEKGVDVCVAILPYEMQISTDAANRYSDMGIDYAKKFREFETQNVLAAHLDPSVQHVILGHSFPEDKIGTYFVYNKGDKIDFNHPNRLGHRILANEMYRARLCMQ